MKGLLWLLLPACGDNLALRDPTALHALVDRNPDPRIVEVDLVAEIATQAYAAGTVAQVWAYRDGNSDAPASVPGPLLEANQGDHVIVHFRNELAEPTTIHWHGIRVPNPSDGTDHTQAAVLPGGTFDYEFDVPDAGTYWYHPHVRGDVQVEKGLYAPIVVHDGVAVPVNADRVMVLDDVKLAADGALDDSMTMDDLMFGRQGNALLVDGKLGATLDAAAGARERWRFVDAANSRFFQVALPGHPFLVIGWDGGMLAAPYETDALLIAPGERYEVIVQLDGAPGEVLTLQTQYYDRALELPQTGTQDLMTIALGAAARAPGPLPTTWGTYEPLPVSVSSVERMFTMHEDSPPNATPRFSINGQVYPDVTPVLGALGDVEIWNIADDVGMDHPWHLHGMFFQVLAIDGVAPAHLGWKDTVIVPRFKRVRYAVRYDRPGHWMFHCHILEHQEAGMMGVLDVE